MKDGETLVEVLSNAGEKDLGVTSPMISSLVMPKNFCYRGPKN